MPDFSGLIQGPDSRMRPVICIKKAASGTMLSGTGLIMHGGTGRCRGRTEKKRALAVEALVICTFHLFGGNSLTVTLMA